MTFDLTTIYNEKRPMSWSAISSFGWNPRQWHHKYVVHKDCTYTDPVKGKVAWCFVTGFADPECPVVKKTIELAFGSLIDQRIQDEPDFIPELVRYPVMQHEMRCEFDGIPLVGIADTFNSEVKEVLRTSQGVRKVVYRHASLRDYKTGRKKWDQKRADETGQLTMYSFLTYMIDKIRPEDLDLYIDWLPTHTKDGQVVFFEDPVVPHVFRTKRTMADALRFGQHIKDTWVAMEEFAGRNAELTEW